MNRCLLNGIYEKLDKKARELSGLLHCDFAYYNGHYYRNESGKYEMEYFPIPVITINGLCDIEIELNQISVTTKLSKNDAVSYNFDKLKSYNFEAYGVENYLEDFYIDGNTIESMIEKIIKSKEENIFFTFSFHYEVDPKIICEFIKFINSEGFFY